MAALCLINMNQSKFIKTALLIPIVVLSVATLLIYVLGDNLLEGVALLLTFAPIPILITLAWPFYWYVCKYKKWSYLRVSVCYPLILSVTVGVFYSSLELMLPNGFIGMNPGGVLTIGAIYMLIIGYAYSAFMYAAYLISGSRSRASA